ncbi:DUF1847 domain-containing protein [Petroclostridium sp. X23]|uniref:DUF1847 domain-containing protein n=1 Tax=Petroclostridium sp. X23 TaxID=3045146 RepID=UPI0024ACC874|nr:DUF1847 domain-containing protein [Petroclostridium sp. X23]WHH61132.1 DUF1847 domain-containing protein [Petroclostridium sp. X23]
MFTCADCSNKPCRTNQPDKFPNGCPSIGATTESVLGRYSPDEIRILKEAAVVEAKGYCLHTRVEETMHLAYRLGYKKIGIGFCAGLSKEAATLVNILRNNDFEVSAICCKSCSISKSAIGISNEEQVRQGQFEAMCNPGFQAEYLNEANVDFNILLGLCVGHDSTFIRHAKAPVTVLSSKDRALGHNAMVALYMADGYFNKRLNNFIACLKKQEIRD